jgi:hypothetical protein
MLNQLPISNITPPETFGLVIVVIIWFVLHVLVDAVFLKVTLEIIDAENKDYKDVFVTSLIISIIGLVLFIHWIIFAIIKAILVWYIISKRHNMSYLKAIGVSILNVIIAVLLIISISFLVGLIIGGIAIPLSLLF